MNVIKIAAFVLLLVTSEVFATPFNFGVAGDFNAFVIGDMNAHNSDVEGRLAVGGNLTLRDYAIGMELGNSNGTRDDLVVGGQIDFKNGRIYHGNARSSDINNPFDQTVGFYSNDPQSPNGSFISGNPIDFSSAANHLRNTSNTLAQQSADGSKFFNNQSGELFLTGGTGFNVFTLTENEIEGVTAFYIDAPLDSDVLINIGGIDVDFSSFGFFRNGQRVPDNNNGNRHDGSLTQKVLFNFFEALDLGISAIGVKGSVLAPFAEVNFVDGHIDGQLFAESFNGSRQGHCCSGQINNYPINQVPEPPTMLLFLFALLWISTRKKYVGVAVTSNGHRHSV